MKITTVGLDLAKSVFTLQGVDERRNIVLRKTVRRARLLELFAQLAPCVVGMEAHAKTEYRDAVSTYSPSTTTLAINGEAI